MLKFQATKQNQGIVMLKFQGTKQNQGIVSSLNLKHTCLYCNH